MKIFNKNYNKFILFIPLIVNTLFVIYLSYRLGNGFLIVHDSPIFTTPSEAKEHFGFLWNSNNFGSVNYLAYTLGYFPQMLSFLLHKLNLPIKFINILFYFLSINTIFYCTWWSLRKILHIIKYKNGLVSSLIATFFYCYNLFMIAAWHGGTADGLVVLFATGPIAAYLFISMLIEKMSLIKVLLLSIVISLSINTAPFAIALYSAFIIPFLFIKERIFTIKNALLLLLLATSSALFSLPVILPLVLAYVAGDPYPLRSGFQAYAFPTNGISGLFRYFFEWTIEQFWGGRNFHSYYPYFKNIIVIITAYILWVIPISALILSTNKVLKKVIIYLVSIIVLGFFVAKANQPPLGYINRMLYDYIPAFSIFRTPDTKFGLPIVLSLSILISIAFVQYKNVFIRSILIIAVVLQTGIFFTGVPIIEVKAGDSYQRIVHIPAEYNNISNILNTDKNEDSVLMFPGLSYANYDFKNGYGITGPDLLAKMIERPTIFSDGFIHGMSEKKYNNLIRGFNAKKITESGIKYVLIRKNVNKIDTIMQEEMLKKNHAYIEVYSSQLGTLFEVNGLRSTPLISFENGSYITYKKISPIKYSLKINNVNSRDKLVFANSYHKGWKLFPKNPNSFFSDIQYLWTKPLFDDSHKIYDDFANSWEIDNRKPDNKELELVLFFTPQSYEYLAIIASGIFLFAGLYYLTINLKPKKK